MKLHQPDASIFVPDQCPVEEAAERITHLGIGAHQDDLEVMAYHGIWSCYKQTDKWFGGVTCTNGAGSLRAGPYGEYRVDDVVVLRRSEQEQAAERGQYGIMIQLDHPSSEVKAPESVRLEEDLRTVLDATRPKVVYTHNPADKHDTHVGVCLAVLNVLRALPVDRQPDVVYGCEAWRDLDWMPDDEKVVLDVSGYEQLANELLSVYQSQITSGKRYDRAVIGRRRAHATFLQTHEIDRATSLIFAMDLTPLIWHDGPDILEYVDEIIQRFRRDVRQKLKEGMGRE